MDNLYKKGLHLEYFTVGYNIMEAGQLYQLSLVGLQIQLPWLDSVLIVS